MKKRGFGNSTVLTLILLASTALLAGEQAQPDELDAFWTEVARTVSEGDFEVYKASYHEDAVLVSGFSKTSMPILEALGGWEQGFIDTRSGKKKVSLEFRFTQRFRDPTTAHEAGIFHYSMTGEDVESVDAYMFFEALLVKKDGWKTLMEYQKAPATQADWDAMELAGSIDETNLKSVQ